MRKKDLETQITECEAKKAALKKEVHELKADLKATHGLLVAEQKRVAGKVSELSFPDLCLAMSAQIDAQIQASAADAAKQWSLVTVRKGLRGL